MFRSHEDEFEPNAESQWIRLLYDKFQPWEDKWVNHHKIPFDEFATICIGTVVEVLQTVLKLKVDLFTGIDSSTIFCKLRSTDENLKIHAQLIKYHLQLKHQEKKTNPYMSIAPYAEFKKDKVNKEGKTVTREKIYQRYDKLDKPVNPSEEEGGSLFRSVDRIYLVYDLVI